MRNRLAVDVRVRGTSISSDEAWCQGKSAKKMRFLHGAAAKKSNLVIGVGLMVTHGH